VGQERREGKVKGWDLVGHVLFPPKGSALQRVYTLGITAGCLIGLTDPSGAKGWFWVLVLSLLIAENPYWKREG
jgi:hypothetical protein